MPDIEEAILLGEQACEAYVEWYNNGHSYEAGAVAYDLVTAIRHMLTALRPQLHQSTKGE